ncbi:MAG: DUF4340 domain-containing protein [Proteobacteria bacterium]|nr:DUF4340 domain-containing protein [Desulfobacula sp.]MBU0973780.1 DUF4340 domain-containing protein [Pseudomonadota bacterium]
MKKENLILALVIAVLSIYLHTGKKDNNNYTLPVLDEVKASEITDISLSKKDTLISIKKKGDVWVLSDKEYLADKSKIDNMIAAIKKIELTALVSENKDLARYELDPANKISVQAKKEEKLLRKLDVGKTATTYNHTFISLEGDDKVYQAKGDFKSQFDKTIAQLRDKSVLSFKPEEIQTILISKNDITQTFTQELEEPPVEGEKNNAKAITISKEKKKIWKSGNNQASDNEVMDDLMTTLKTLECEEYTKIEEKDPFWSKKMIAKVAIQGANELVIFEKEDEKYPAISSDNAYPLLLSDNNGKNILDLVDKILGIENKESKDAAKTE